MGPTHLGVVDETRCEWMTSKIRTDVTYPKLSRLQVRVTQVWNQVRDTEKTIRATKCSIFIHPSCGRHSLMSVLEICETNYMDLDESVVIIFFHQCWSCHWASLCSCFLHFCEDDEEEVYGLWRLQFWLCYSRSARNASLNDLWRALSIFEKKRVLLSRWRTDSKSSRAHVNLACISLQERLYSSVTLEVSEGLDTFRHPCIWARDVSYFSMIFLSLSFSVSLNLE